MTYDDAVFTVTIEVTEDADKGELTASEPVIQVTRNGETEDAESVSFTNTYTPEEDRSRRTNGGGGGGGGGRRVPARQPETPGTDAPAPITAPEIPAAGRLPKTGEQGSRLPAALAVLGLFGTLFGFRRKKDEDEEE